MKSIAYIRNRVNRLSLAFDSHKLMVKVDDQTVFLDFHQLVLACHAAMNGAADTCATRIALRGTSEDEFAKKALELFRATQSQDTT